MKRHALKKYRQPAQTRNCGQCALHRRTFVSENGKKRIGKFCNVTDKEILNTADANSCRRFFMKEKPRQFILKGCL